ncbi:thiamine-phosphate kinase, partial [Candidatus Micrarchaeota archaeon]|nr:thiamine-phosphate kinase [Candidatus Micrarchaeota archaeon]
MKLSDIGEFGFIDRIEPLSIVRKAGVIKGIGDDCAVIDMEGEDYLLVTTDLLVERVHYMMDWAGPRVIGEKALAVNLSDIAACGGTPMDAFISLAIPSDITIEWLDGLYEGMASLGRKYNCNLLGGDTTGSVSDLIINITVTGRVNKNKVLYRHTAQPGDIIIVTGPLGASAAGLDLLLKDNREARDLFPQLTETHLSPRPHLEEARILADSGFCRAAIDMSDGLSSDLAHICEASEVGAVLEQSLFPVAESLTDAGEYLGKDPMDWALHGGEVYALLATIDEKALDELRQAFAK